MTFNRKKSLKISHTHLFYLYAERRSQVVQASLHQVGQIFVNGLMADVFQAVITKQHIQRDYASAGPKIGRLRKHFAFEHDRFKLVLRI